jgi:hypothetical protein
MAHDGRAMRTPALDVRSLQRAVAMSGWPALALCGVAGLVAGGLAAASPKMAAAALAGAAVIALALRAPVTLLLVLLALTAVVPYELQHPFAIGASETSPGLLPSDALLAGAMLRAALLVPGMPLDPRRRLAVVLICAFLLVCALQTVHGLRMGANLSVAGAEFRRLLGFGTLLFALPVLDEAPNRRRILAGMLVLGLVLGLWGIAQWTMHIDFGGAGDFGVRQGVSLTTGGVGQLQGGLFVYPVAVLLSLAALMSGTIESRRARVLTVAVLVLNFADLLLTYERTFWIATVLGAVFLLARSGRAARRRVGRWAPAALVGLAVTIALTPSTFVTAEQRLLSVSQYSSDKSVHYRVVESEHVLAKIRAHPLTGSGLGATIFWGRPEEGVPPQAYNYSHDGYLWLSWKVGIPGALLLLALMATAALWRAEPDVEPLFLAVRRGSQASLLMLLVVSATFPVFNSLQITVLAGLLLAIAAMPGVRRRPAA